MPSQQSVELVSGLAVSPDGSTERVWRCDWTPDDLNPAEDGCPYCADRMCARLDGLNCRHDRVERHGYRAVGTTSQATHA